MIIRTKQVLDILFRIFLLSLEKATYMLMLDRLRFYEILDRCRRIDVLLDLRAKYVKIYVELCRMFLETGQVRLGQGSQTTARVPHPACEQILTGSQII